MKTKLIIKDDLKPYLYKETDRSSEYTKKLEAKYARDSFDWQWLFKFNNGYGASVVKFYGSYGFDEDLFELAVISWSEDDDSFDLDYSTSITDDVIGYLTNDDVMETLTKINSLKGEEKHENK